jgi:succinate dehydrogenase / fumarate reductase cytochrome b subunit
VADTSLSFLERHEFLIRRLHSLSGLIPVGAFMCVHLVVNSSVLNSAETFQDNVYKIHALDKALPLVEWLFIFLPIIFHAVIGIVIIRGGLPNTGRYAYGANWRYTLQRATGVIAFFFIFWHVFHMHGWFHGDWWMQRVVQPLGGAQFKPYNASSTLATAMTGVVVPVLYAIGVLSCVFHLANGIWTMGITWGAWTTPKAQKTALAVCTVFGVALGGVGMSALWGTQNITTADGQTDIDDIRDVENRMYQARVEQGSATPNEHKRYHADGHADGHAEGEQVGEADEEIEIIEVETELELTKPE